MKRISIFRYCQLATILLIPIMPIFAQSSASDTNNSSDTGNSSDINLNGADRSHLPVSPQVKIEGADLLPVDSDYSFPEIRAGMPIETGSSDRLGTPNLEIANEQINLRAFMLNGKHKSAPPPEGAGIYRAPTLPDWVAAGAVFGSNIAANELMQGCLAAHSCLSIPGPMRSRAAMYEVGLPAAAAVSYLGYYLKRREKRWWFVPSALAVAFNLVIVVRATERPH